MFSETKVTEIYPKSVIRNFCEQNVRQQPLL